MNYVIVVMVWCEKVKKYTKPTFGGVILSEHLRTMNIFPPLTFDRQTQSEWLAANIDAEHRKKQPADAVSPDLVQAMCDGDMDAFRQIYLHSYDKLREFLTFLLHSKEDAEEAVQDIFLYILENRDKIDPHQKFRNYLFAIAKNAAYKQMRRRKLDEKYHDYHLNYPPGFADSPDEIVMTDELALMISIYIDNMPTQRRRVFELSRKEGKSISEIAEIMQISPQTVKNYLQTATNGLRELIALFAFLFLS